ncbi:hypothetical protein BX600DRAFT_553557 [Xylariales sp. PMI_506]|nr:hypothetical protein BX600DRAFT_553557 [Xylariales sp. PMI_506]
MLCVYLSPCFVLTTTTTTTHHQHHHHHHHHYYQASKAFKATLANSSKHIAQNVFKHAHISQYNNHNIHHGFHTLPHVLFQEEQGSLHWLQAAPEPRVHIFLHQHPQDAAAT